MDERSTTPSDNGTPKRRLQRRLREPPNEFNNFVDSLMKAMATFIAPDSFMLDPEITEASAPPTIPRTPEETAASFSSSSSKRDLLSYKISLHINHAIKKIKPGDIVLLRTPGLFYDAFRALCQSRYDHVVVILDPPTTAMHIGPPVCKQVATHRVLHPKFHPKILRPQFPTNPIVKSSSTTPTNPSTGEIAEHAKRLQIFLNLIKAFDGVRYNLVRALSLVWRIAFRVHLNVVVQPLPLLEVNQLLPSLDLARSRVNLFRGRGGIIAAGRQGEHENQEGTFTRIGANIDSVLPTIGLIDGNGSGGLKGNRKVTMVRSRNDYTYLDGFGPICTDSVLWALLRAGGKAWNEGIDNFSYLEIGEEKSESGINREDDQQDFLDYQMHGSASLSDFVSIGEKMQHLLKPIPLPHWENSLPQLPESDLISKENSNSQSGSFSGSSSSSPPRKNGKAGSQYQQRGDKFSIAFDKILKSAQEFAKTSTVALKELGILDPKVFQAYDHLTIGETRQRIAENLQNGFRWKRLAKLSTYVIVFLVMIRRLRAVVRIIYTAMAAIIIAKVSRTIVESQSLDDDIRFHIGTASNTESFLLEPNGPTAAYEGLVKEMCKFDKHLCNINDVRAVADAQKGGGQYYLSARRDCGCQQIIHDGNPLYYLPNENDDANMVYFRAIHEYTHAVQKSFFGDVPNWLMEGPAVYNECIFSNKPSFSTESFASCMRNNIRGAVELYRSDYKTYLTTYGADRGCSGPAASDPNNPVPPNGYVPGGDDAVHKLYYNVGPVATAFAIAKAANKSSDQGGIVEFWTGTGKKGYWHSVEEYPLDPWSGWASQVPEGKGWKKALADFTGYSTTADFYAAFENWIAPGGQVKTVDELMELVTTYPFQQSNVEKARDTIANFGNIAPRLPKDADGKVCSGTSQSRLGWICQLLIPLAILFLTSA
eukprot:g404.t1